jgi:hypothetical protein
VPAWAAELAFQTVHERLQSRGVEQALRLGRAQGPLAAYFGEQATEELRELAREAGSRVARGGQRVWILPGIMGSTLGVVDEATDQRDVIWFDPFDILRGRLYELALRRRARYDAIGVVLLAYLKLRLRLQIAGFDADYWPFDWRERIATSGARLAAELRRASGRGGIALVAHSMGGLVARSAIAQGAPVERLVMLGTPNGGSFAPVQALRGTYPIVRKVAALDVAHSAEELARDVFGTFPGLYQMLPAPERFRAVDLFTASNWPGRRYPAPRQTLLTEARDALAGLAHGDARFSLIAGINQETVTSLRVEGDEFLYETSPAGDGTVPLALAQLPGVRTWYVAERHGSLPNNGAVNRAVIELLRGGDTSALPRDWTPVQRGVRVTGDAGLAEETDRQFERRRGRALSDGEIRRLLEEVAAPPEPAAGPVAAAPEVTTNREGGSWEHRFSGVTVGRRSDHRLDLTLVCGDITAVDARAYVLGLFRGVAPTGAARAIDAALGGAVSEFTARRMFSGNVGEVFTLPAGRRALGAESILWAGLGAFDQFTDDVLQLAAENAMRTFVRTNVEDFATLLIGVGSGWTVGRSLANMTAGFLRALRASDQRQRVRGFTLCERDPARYAELKAELYRLASTALFDGFQVTIDELDVAPAPAPTLVPARAAQPPAGSDPAYLLVRSDGNGTSPVLHFSLLSAGGKASVLSCARELPGGFAPLLAQLGPEGPGTERQLAVFSARLRQDLLPAEIVEALRAPQLAALPLVVVHDADASRVPWEALEIPLPDGRAWRPAVAGGMSRRLEADHLSVAKWLEERRLGPRLSVLMVVNPLLDLGGAEDEAERLAAILNPMPAVAMDVLHGNAATRSAVLAAFRSGRYDVVHYAGHAFFDPRHPERSGLRCADATLSGADLTALGALPALVFFNACEAARIRGRGGRRGARPRQLRQRLPATKHEAVARSVGVAEALLRGGIANYIGTFWPVGDAAAAAFAATFYRHVVNGQALGDALRRGREAVAALPSPDWADYVHFGSHDFVLKPR